ncbi:MAG TPA: UDP pyrophosphate synthetase [Candidatus Syntrophoarchaeum butanivorans]|uniref:UDP pyrophosphate synthetase n=1 Tax=Candidatus Syntropharchaeum butanivorans TaxID=1839936 RepID=A0A1F2P692_9EURY|nr:MAG: undecaprenyl pyrophosphate synthetase [Candidatus Syntrophoarchaeum butanivorans]RJS71786.1 MAG: UDP pyrophosphate synthetase [Candidatus Syntrophoarchaeum sp. WYZ-LMO15]HDM35975.1 UDP pyrophosphate synthetase [Candidatus Syntrophoarchaeum butanivorans]HEC57698.1 UDP pyrophosphate synthetase [Candidatus Syntrophoarchaeum butanivorans]
MLRKLLQRVYEPYLRRTIEGVPINHILLVITANDLAGRGGIAKLARFIEWCFDLSINHVSIYISMAEDDDEAKIPDLMENVYRELERIDANLDIYTHKSQKLRRRGGMTRDITVSIGLGGRDELVYVTREIMEEVSDGKISPHEINEDLVESKLIFKSSPDLIIRSGKSRLTDFLIWQAVYSELYFTDVSWSDFRRIDLLRAVRDYKYRERRFGR